MHALLRRERLKFQVFKSAFSTLRASSSHCMTELQKYDWSLGSFFQLYADRQFNNNTRDF